MRGEGTNFNGMTFGVVRRVGPDLFSDVFGLKTLLGVVGNCLSFADRRVDCGGGSASCAMDDDALDPWADTCDECPGDK
jgi:hypothetical protein